MNPFINGTNEPGQTVKQNHQFVARTDPTLLQGHTTIASTDEAAATNQAWQQLPLPNNTKDLLFCKLFYFCFYAAFGSLFPLMGVYFKQLGMSPLQTGWLIGVRPFIELFSAPFWMALANRHGKGTLFFPFA